MTSRQVIGLPAQIGHLIDKHTTCFLVYSSICQLREILLVRIFELILLINSPLPVIVFAFMLQNTFLLQSRKVTFDGALAHRQSLRHLSASDCRRLFDEIKDFLLTLSRFRLRHVSVMVSDTRDVGRGKDDGLKGLWRKYVRGECETSLHDHFTKPQSFYAKSGETEVI